MSNPPFDLLESNPADDALVSQHPSDERQFREDVESYLNTDHDSSTGHHKHVVLPESGSVPSRDSNEGALYTKDDGGDTELFYTDDSGRESQLTVDGQVNGVPSGGIIAWSGSIASIPSGWALCDGNNGTPDLRNRFIVGAGDTYSVDGTGGSTSHDHGGSTADHTLTVDEIPSHTHTEVRNGGTQAGGSGGGNVLNDPTTTDTGSTGGDGAHSHDISSADHLPPYYALAYIMKL